MHMYLPEGGGVVVELVGGSCEEEVVGWGGASLEDGCWSVVDERGGGVGEEGSAGELVEGEKRGERTTG